jgi:hypothetical protein
MIDNITPLLSLDHQNEAQKNLSIGCLSFD